MRHYHYSVIAYPDVRHRQVGECGLLVGASNGRRHSRVPPAVGVLVVEKRLAAEARRLRNEGVAATIVIRGLQVVEYGQQEHQHALLSEQLNCTENALLITAFACTREENHVAVVLADFLSEASQARLLTERDREYLLDVVKQIFAYCHRRMRQRGAFATVVKPLLVLVTFLQVKSLAPQTAKNEKQPSNPQYSEHQDHDQNSAERLGTVH